MPIGTWRRVTKTLGSTFQLVRLLIGSRGDSQRRDRTGERPTPNHSHVCLRQSSLEPPIERKIGRRTERPGKVMIPCANRRERDPTAREMKIAVILCLPPIVRAPLQLNSRVFNPPTFSSDHGDFLPHLGPLHPPLICVFPPQWDVPEPCPTQ